MDIVRLCCSLAFVAAKLSWVVLVDSHSLRDAWVDYGGPVGPLRAYSGGWLQPWPIGTLLDPGPACTSDLNGHRYGVIVFFDFFFAY